MVPRKLMFGRLNPGYLFEGRCLVYIIQKYQEDKENKENKENLISEDYLKYLNHLSLTYPRTMYVFLKDIICALSHSNLEEFISIYEEDVNQDEQLNKEQKTILLNIIKYIIIDIKKIINTHGHTHDDLILFEKYLKRIFDEALVIEIKKLILTNYNEEILNSIISIYEVSSEYIKNNLRKIKKNMKDY